MNDSALSTQVGGSHYKRWAIQPVEFAQRNGWDFCASSALKYLSRFDAKDGLIDLKKGRHFGQLRLDLMPVSNWKLLEAIRFVFSNKNQKSGLYISMTSYIEQNQITDPELCAVLNALDRWVRGIDPAGSLYFASLHKLIQARYPGQA